MGVFPSLKISYVFDSDFAIPGVVYTLTRSMRFYSDMDVKNLYNP